MGSFSGGGGGAVSLTDIEKPAIGDVVTSGTAGSVIFLDSNHAWGQDNANLFWDTTGRTLKVANDGVYHADHTFATFGAPIPLLSYSFQIHTQNDNNNLSGAAGILAEEDNSDGAGFAEGLQVVARANNASGNVTLYGIRAGVESPGGGNSPTMTALEASIAGPTGSGTSTNAYAVNVLPATSTVGITNLFGINIGNQAGGTNNYAIRTGLGKVELGAVAGEVILDGATASTPAVFNSSKGLISGWAGSATLDFGSLVAAGCEDLTIAVAAAKAGDPVMLGVPNASVVANGNYSAWVSADGTVSVRFCTVISGNPSSGTFKVSGWNQ